MEKIEVFCPAKVNLFLAVTGRRGDRFHDLVSLMVALDIGDRLTLEREEEPGIGLVCDDPEIPGGNENLAVRAAEIYRERFPFSGGLRIVLDKKLPSGAGLGGG
ncbi:MAG TPA: 4-(cytidine 5'-diphospho)-2-C-methyl-D-erythritol kinase, partial [Opitutales bacterium]|nr:4-(cytidine 5'-diphospho)-2-C-methyl-D-erythritol kinase [Opitutales bacterium]